MRAVIVYNPTAGSLGGRQTEQRVAWAVEALQACGWAATVRRTSGPGEMRRLAEAAAAEGAEAVFAAGGDGTVGAAASALAGSQVVLGVLPIGTANIWAVELGLNTPLRRPAHMRACIEAQVNGEIRRVDLGRSAGRTFLLWAGLGLDGHVIHRVEPRPEFLKRLGEFYFYAAGLIAALDFRGAAMTVRTENGAMSGHKLLAIVTNIRRYAGARSTLDANARADDGVLDVWTMDGRRYWDALAQLVRYKRGRHVGHSSVHKLAGRNIVIETTRPMMLQLDGEIVGPVSRAEFSVWPAALRVLAPHKPLPVFGRPPEQ